MKSIVKLFLIAAVILVAIGLGIYILARSINYLPAPVETVQPVCRRDDAPLVPAGMPLKVMTWNVQYMAGKNYTFFYDVPTGDGPDERPSPEDISATFEEVARVIADEDPDILLLQEIDEGAKRTDKEDQLARLLAMIPDTYPCHAETFYWRSAYVPHSRIRGPVGMKLVTLSKFRISAATRHQLALIPKDPITELFNFKRCILEIRLPLDDGGEMAVLNTHLSAFAQGTDNMERQVTQVKKRLDALTGAGIPWVIGGDFNLLPPGQYAMLAPERRVYYLEETELLPLWEQYTAIPGKEQLGDGVARAKDEIAQWFTHLSNDLSITEPEKTIDYIFISPEWSVVDARVRQRDTLHISDHFPVVATLRQTTAPSPSADEQQVAEGEN